MRLSVEEANHTVDDSCFDNLVEQLLIGFLAQISPNDAYVWR